MSYMGVELDMGLSAYTIPMYKKATLNSIEIESGFDETGLRSNRFYIGRWSVPQPSRPSVYYVIVL